MTNEHQTPMQPGVRYAKQSKWLGALEHLEILNTFTKVG